jgi:alpha-amylase/alpha-mannosidase (GH57 family)
LLAKRGQYGRESDLDHAASLFTPQDWRDLQTWFNLTWCGYAACKRYAALAELKRKGRDFTEEDKQLVLRLQREIMRGVVEHFRDLAQQDRIELSTTPYFHPILPLVMDTEYARRNLPRAPLPQRFAFPEDARAQLVLAREQHQQVFGKPPRGLWPSEGSVCPEMIPLLRETRFEWFATDEAILWRSLDGNREPHALYEPYRVELPMTEQAASPPCSVAVFRDRGLSDFIGFTASRNTAQQAVDFIAQNLRTIAENLGARDGLLTIALDGENAWEHFADGGEELLRSLYRMLTSDPRLRPTTISDYVQAHPPTRALKHLHTGSWINADFDIWIGSAEENRAYELLGQARRVVQQRIDGGTIGESDKRAALDAIYAAEGSDWFWWYGDDFVTLTDEVFDALFRAHLREAYLRVGVRPPATLDAPIRRSPQMQAFQPPRDLIEPLTDGLPGSFFEWYQAGHFLPDKAQGAMYRSERIVRGLLFGFSMEKIFFRVDFSPPHPPADAVVRFCLEKASGAPGTFFITVPLDKPAKLQPAIFSRGSKDILFEETKNDSVRFALKELLEVEIAWSAIGAQAGEHLGFYLQVLCNGLETERYPAVGSLPLTLPDENFELRNWRV